LLRRIRILGDLGQIGDLERAEFTAAERPGKAQAQQCAVTAADHAVGEQRDHLADQICCRRRLALLGAADGPADAAQHGLDGLAAGWRFVAGHLVMVADGGGAATDGAGLAAAVGEAGEIGGDDALVRWQGCGAPGGAPSGEVPASPKRRPPWSPAPSPPRR
jgi:hypothetical protein